MFVLAKDLLFEQHILLDFPAKKFRHGMLLNGRDRVNNQSLWVT